VKQALVIQELTRRVRDAKAQTRHALEAWQATAATSYTPNDPRLEAYRADWQRARDQYVRLLEAYFLAATGALADADDLEARLDGTAAALAVLA
jgi:hypothetical protein